jgi:phosphoribosylformylglycinamidine cyclo-ligase
MNDRLPALGKTVGEALLVPTRIYAKAVRALLDACGDAVHGLSHITGGGIGGNLPRVLPDGLGARVDLSKIPVVPIFKWLAREGDIAQNEMLRTFNCGVGMIAVVARADAEKVNAAFTAAGERVVTIGEITKAADESRVTYAGKLDFY